MRTLYCDRATHLPHSRVNEIPLGSVPNGTFRWERVYRVCAVPRHCGVTKMLDASADGVEGT